MLTALLFGGILLAGNIALGISGSDSLRSAYREIEGTRDALDALYLLRRTIYSLSEDQRQFVASGDLLVLKRYQAVRDSLRGRIAILRALTTERPAQQWRIDLGEQLLAQQGIAMDALAANRRFMSAGDLLSALSEFEHLSGDLLGLIGAIHQAERELQAEQIGVAQQRIRHMELISLARTLFSITLIGLVFCLAWRHDLARRVLAAERAAALAGAADAIRAQAVARQRVEQALRSRETLLRGLEDAIPHIVFLVHGDGSGEFLNRRWCDYTGTDPVFARGLAWIRCVHPEDVARVRQQWREATRTGAPLVMEFRLRRRDGEYLWFLAQVVPLREAEFGADGCRVGTFTDIDDIRRADMARRKSEDRFRRIFEGSPFGITLSVGEDRRLVQANPAFCRMLGYAPGELIGHTLSELSPAEDQGNTLFPQLAGADPEWRTRERRYLTKTGGLVWARVRASVFDPLDGGEPQVMCVVEDVTRQRELDEALRQAQRMEAVGQLAGGIAHDFNNLLGVIIGCTECLLDALPDDTEKAELAHEALDSALAGAELTRRLLAFGRRQALSPQRIDLSAQVGRHVTLLRRTLGSAIRVETVFAADLWATCADPSRLDDALLNLAINARDAMPHGGVLTIETYNDRMAPGDYVVLAVSDTGVGMAPDVRARAMEPFFTTKPPGAGSGLGLSMIYGFVRQSGGQLAISSEAGVGTTVRICLPRIGGQAEIPMAEAPPAELPTGTETILLVDDSAEMRQVAERHLRFLGYSVLSAEHGPAALALLEGGAAVDLLFTDIAMPEGLNGFALAEAARAVRPGLPVVFTTGYAGVEAGESTGDWRERLIRKPYRRTELARTIRAAFAD